MFIEISGTRTLNRGYKSAVMARLSTGLLLDIVTFDCDNSMSKAAINYTLRLPIETLLKNKNEWVIISCINTTEEIVEVKDVASLTSNVEIGIETNLAFPSIGFFGNAKGSKLSVSVKRPLDAFVVKVDENPGILNIGGIEILCEDGTLLKPKADFDIEFSSSIPENADPYKVFNDKGFHSSREKSPFLKVIFKGSQNVDTITIRNRSDKWGIRAKKLHIEGIYEGSIINLHRPSDALPFLTNQLITLGWQLSDELSSDTEKRTHFLAFLANHLNIEMVLQDNRLVSFLEQCLSSWTLEPIPSEQENLELELLALVLTAQMQKGISLNLKPFATILSTREAINKLEDKVNEARLILNKETIKFTKHGVARRGCLIDDIPAVMATLSEIMAMLEDMELQPCLAYGTLLGAKRDNAFISHDDDVDILVRLPEEEISEHRARQLRDEILKALPEDQFRIDYGQQHNLNIHLYSKKTGVMIDIFPYWISEGKAYLHMENMTIRGIDAGIFDGRKSLELYGQALPTPKLIENFLFERYGSGWTISDKFHEWPWKLKDDD